MARAAVVSDIHCNLKALTAVVRDAEHARVDEFWCLGDVAGYGAKPRQCFTLLRSVVREGAWVLGNHDAACIGLRPTIGVNEQPKVKLPDRAWWTFLGKLGFTPDAIAALQVNWRLLRRDHEDCMWIEHLPLITSPHDHFVLVHGGLRNQTPLVTYIVWPFDAPLEFQHLRQSDFSNGRYLLTGHTHHPALFRTIEADPTKLRAFTKEDIVYAQPLDLGTFAIINPGSIGQPRDEDSRSAYAIVDTTAGTVEFRRVLYDIVAVQQQMQQLHLPEELINRLGAGM